MERSMTIEEFNQIMKSDQKDDALQRMLEQFKSLDEPKKIIASIQPLGWWWA